jgi:hypothetical protein
MVRTPPLPTMVVQDVLGIDRNKYAHLVYPIQDPRYLDLGFNSLVSVFPESPKGFLRESLHLTSEMSPLIQ